MLCAMRRALGPHLCELHAHSRWSDGALDVAELVDLHGRTPLSSPHDEAAVVDYLRSARPVYLVKLDDGVVGLAA
jgi:hypothetical protein